MSFFFSIACIKGIMNFTFLDPKDNVGIPPPMKYAGLYASDEPYTQTQWSKDYRGDRVDPDAVAYSKHYNPLAKSHIPTTVRPGNNTIQKNPFMFSSKTYNSMCFVDN